MTLHILSQPPSHNAFQSGISHVSEGDVVLLINDGVYGLNQALSGTWPSVARQAVFALEQDSLARGITAEPSALIDYDAFVALTSRHNPIQSWY
ncbi:MAG TPA: sulfurtransferase complex subunit TusB [Marinagarivorans sp.]